MQSIFKFRHTQKIIIVILPLIIFLLIATINLRNPGIQYDEILFGNAAVGVVDGSFVTTKFGKIPILLMPYIGALKAYVYFPIFLLFGVSELTIRLPMILLTVVSILIIYLVSKRLLGAKFALLTTLFFSISPSLISQTRLDVGPNAIEFFLKALSLLLLYKFYKSKEKKYYLFLLLTLFLGVFNKLNFIWFVNSVFLVIFLYKLNHLRSIGLKKYIKENLKSDLMIFIPYLIYLLYYVLISQQFKISGGLALNFNELRGYIENWFRTISGISFLRYLYDYQNTPINVFYALTTILTILTGFIYSIKNKLGRYVKFYLLLFVFIFSTILQIFLTREASAPWHAFTIEPFYTLTLALSVFIILKHFKNIILPAVLLIFIVFYNIAINITYLNSYATSTYNIAWNNKIYELIEYTRSSNLKFASVDWGTHNQLITFDQNDDKYEEVVWMFADMETQEKKDWLYDNYLAPENNYTFIIFGDVSGLIKKSSENFFNLAEERGIEFKEIKRIKDQNKSIYILYKAEYGAIR